MILPSQALRALSRFDGPFNMAADARLLTDAESGRPGIRVYGWNGPWVSLGCYQHPERDLLKPSETQWVMRPTGGKAVLHGHDVTVGLALPLSLLASISKEPEERLARSLKSVYRLAIAPIVAAMRVCGSPAVLAADKRSDEPTSTLIPPFSRAAREGGRVADCFAVTSPNDIVHEKLGVKVCGCALKLTQRAVLVQASIPAGPPLIDPATIFERPSQIPFVPWDTTGFEDAMDDAMASQFAQIDRCP